MPNTSYTQFGEIVEMPKGRIFATAANEDNARHISACINACNGLDLERIEAFQALPLFLECNRLRELVSDLQETIRSQSSLITGYEGALKNLPDADTLAELERTGW